MATKPKTTRIADDTTQAVPQTTSPGDAPADTYDWKERASSARPDKAAAAAAGHGSVNAIEPVASVVSPAPSGSRSETYTRVGADGVEYTITHNYDTGVTTKTP